MLGKIFFQNRDAPVEEYYKLVSKRQYADAWSLLTSNYHRLNPDDNYKSFEDWWNRVNHTQINSISLIKKSKNKAIVDAELIYFKKNGEVNKDPYGRFTVVLSNDKWLIDNKTEP